MNTVIAIFAWLFFLQAAGAATYGLAEIRAGMLRQKSGIIALVSIILQALGWGVVALRYSFAVAQAEVILQRTSDQYDYVPSVIKEKDGYKVWWCAGRIGRFDGDRIFGASTKRFPLKTYHHAFGPSNEPGAFDSLHTCDPSVLRVGGTWFLYYGGQNGQKGVPTAIGLATRKQRSGWVRSLNGEPIVRSQGTDALNVDYGTGQPSVTYHQRMFWMIYTDTYAHGANPVNGAGAFVMRSSDPKFQTRVEALQEHGFVPLEDLQPGKPESAERYEQRTKYSLFEAYSVDWAWSPSRQAFIIAHHHEQGLTHIDALRFTPKPERRALRVIESSRWVDGPALVKRPNGTIGQDIQVMISACDYRTAHICDVFKSELTAIN